MLQTYNTAGVKNTDILIPEGLNVCNQKSKEHPHNPSGIECLQTNKKQFIWKSKPKPKPLN